MRAVTVVSSLSLGSALQIAKPLQHGGAGRQLPSATSIFAICITMHRARANVSSPVRARRGPGATRGPKSTSSWCCVLFEAFLNHFSFGAIVPREFNSGEYTVRCEKSERRMTTLG